LKRKLKGRHFDITEVIEAESQVALNTTSRMHLKNGRSAENRAYMQKGATSRVMAASRPKVSFDQMAAPIPEIMDSPVVGEGAKYFMSYSATFPIHTNVYFQIIKYK
jgi:hypothetical protein